MYLCGQQNGSIYPTPDENGAADRNESSREVLRTKDDVRAKFKALQEIEPNTAIFNYLQRRGISMKTIKAAKVKATGSYSSKTAIDTICFVYYDTVRLRDLNQYR